LKGGRGVRVIGDVAIVEIVLGGFATVVCLRLPGEPDRRSWFAPALRFLDGEKGAWKENFGFWNSRRYGDVESSPPMNISACPFVLLFAPDSSLNEEVWRGQEGAITSGAIRSLSPRSRGVDEGDDVSLASRYTTASFSK